MPDTAKRGARSTGRRTLAEKLQWLRELKTPKGEQPPSYDATARHITQSTGVSISGPYVWELVTGRTTNPKLHHLQALARYFNVPISYLTDEDAGFERLESELELLHTLKAEGVRNISFQGAGQSPTTDLATIQGLLGKLQILGISDDEEVRERLTMLGPPQREALKEVISDTGTLEALADENLRDLTRDAADLNADQTATLTAAARRPDLLDALRSETVRRIALHASGLSEQSQRAVLAMIDHLLQVEHAAES